MVVNVTKVLQVGDYGSPTVTIFSRKAIANFCSLR